MVSRRILGIIICCMALFLARTHSSDLLLTDSPIDVLALENIDSFVTLELTYEVYKQWPNLSLQEKIPFLVDKFFVQGVKRDFLSFASAIETPILAHNMTRSVNDSTNASIHSVEVSPSSLMESSVPRAKYVIFPDKLLTALQDFQTEEQIAKFFADCDLDKDKEMSWGEYLVCRGYYDTYGNNFGMGEFDYLENIIISDFTTKLSDPNDPLALELIERGLL